MAKKKAAGRKPRKGTGTSSTRSRSARPAAARTRRLATAPRSLDPRLRRLVQSAGDRRRLRRDVARAFVAAESAESPTAASTFKRVLCKLSRDRLPERLADLAWSQIVPGIYSVNVPLDRLRELATAPEVEYVSAGHVLTPDLDTSLPEARVPEVHNPTGGGAGLTGRNVIVGIIDFGFDFTLNDFRNADGTTRVALLWDQTLTPRAGEHSPADFPHGVEYDAATINQALQAADPFSVVRHRPDPGSHGTHVAGTAAGNGRSGDAQFPAGRFIGVAPDATLILVQPSASDQTTSFTDSVHVAEAVAYIFRRAVERDLPCAINMSLGQNGGSHDGESIVERAIDRLLDEPGRAFVVAGGNEHIWRTHAAGRITADEVRALHWKAGGQMPLPGGGATGAGPDVTPNEMEIWYSSRDRFRVRVHPPTGAASPWVEPGQTVLHNFAGGNQAFIDSERFAVMNGDARIYIEIDRGSAGSVRSGVWRVELEALEVRDGSFHAWIERDARRQLNNFADQSFFVGSDFDPTVTLGTPATTRRAIVVANYNHVTQAPNESSGRGPTRDGRAKPDLAAPGTGILSSGALGGRPAPGGGVFPMRVPMSGTSMAAPHVAGAAALLFEHNPRLSGEQVRKILVAGANPPSGIDSFDAAWGFGRLAVRAAADAIG